MGNCIAVDSILARDALGLFKADLSRFTRYYEFMSQIVDYDSTDLERLSLNARHLVSKLRTHIEGPDSIDLSNVQLTHLPPVQAQAARPSDGEGRHRHQPIPATATAIGTGKAKNKQEAWLSETITRLNETFVTDNPTDNDMLNYTMTLRDKVRENSTHGAVLQQLPRASPPSSFNDALDDAVIESNEAHQNQMMQHLNNRAAQGKLRRIVFDMLLAKHSENTPPSPRANVSIRTPTSVFKP